MSGKKIMSKKTMVKNVASSLEKTQPWIGCGR